jgi:hypothetical protein
MKVAMSNVKNSIKSECFESHFIVYKPNAYIKNKQNPILYLHAEHSEAQYGILHYEIQLDCLCEKRTWPIESLVACMFVCLRCRIEQYTYRPMRVY